MLKESCFEKKKVVLWTGRELITFSYSFVRKCTLNSEFTYERMFLCTVSLFEKMIFTQLLIRNTKLYKTRCTAVKGVFSEEFDAICMRLLFFQIYAFSNMS